MMQKFIRFLLKLIKHNTAYAFSYGDRGGSGHKTPYFAKASYGRLFNLFRSMPFVALCVVGLNKFKKASKSRRTPPVPGDCITIAGFQKKFIVILFLIFITGCADRTQQNKLEQEVVTSQTVEQVSENNEPEDVKIQLFQEMLTYKNLSMMGTEIAVAMLAAQGASMANAYITAQGQLLSTKISRDSQTIQTSMQSFQASAQKNQQTKLQIMMTAFSDAQKDVQTQSQQASIVSNLELDYIYKNLSIDQPQQNYIFNQILFDQLFTLGTMITPERMVWKNPFSVGDWEYDKESNSFWQYQSSPIFNAEIDDTGKPSAPSSQQAENNSIFTEYFTNAQSYAIAGSITLYRVDYPFFAGITFNKTRWISGDFQSIRKCRMMGIYATSPTDIGIYFAQQYTMTEQQLKLKPKENPVQTPLQQILQRKVNKLIKLPVGTFNTTPVTVHFEITNSPTNVTIEVAIDEQEPMIASVKNIDPGMYMYHGIGFISPGAVAQFNLTEPSDLVFTTDDILNYKD